MIYCEWSSCGNVDNEKKLNEKNDRTRPFRLDFELFFLLEELTKFCNHELNLENKENWMTFIFCIILSVCITFLVRLHKRIYQSNLCEKFAVGTIVRWWIDFTVPIACWVVIIDATKSKIFNKLHMKIHKNSWQNGRRQSDEIQIHHHHMWCNFGKVSHDNS